MSGTHSSRKPRISIPKHEGWLHPASCRFPAYIFPKLATEEQIQAHAAASRRGALEGTLVAGTIATLGSVYSHRRWAYYRNLPPSLKVLGVLIVAAPALSIQAERRGLEYDKSQWCVSFVLSSPNHMNLSCNNREGEGARMLDAHEHKEMTRWQSMSTGDKVADWASRHEYSIIVGSWALSLALAGGIISRNK